MSTFTRFLFSYLFVLSVNVYAATEFSGQFSYQKNVYGSEDQNSLVNRTYSGSIAAYIFGPTAIEINYSYSEAITTENNSIPIDSTTVSITSLQNRVENIVYGVGIRQAFAGQKALIRPLISVGYAKQFIRDGTDFTFYNSSTDSTIVSRGEVSKSRQDSIFGVFSLQLRFSKRFSVQGSVKTVFAADEFDDARNNLQYLLGLSMWW